MRGTIKNGLRWLTGCGTQHPHRALGGTCVLLAAAPTTPPCFRHWRRSSSLLTIFSGKNFRFCVCRALRSAPNAFSRVGSWRQTAFAAPLAAQARRCGGRFLQNFSGLNPLSHRCAMPAPPKGELIALLASSTLYPETLPLCQWLPPRGSWQSRQALTEGVRSKPLP